jgi:hypothetical protein
MPFLPTLQSMVKENPYRFVANMSLILLEVSPRPSHLSFLVSCGLVWGLEYTGNNTFWVEYGFGRRWCSLFDAIVRLDTKEITADYIRKTQIDQLLAELVKVVVSEASRLEQVLQLLS